jgi:hypothetical protein
MVDLYPIVSSRDLNDNMIDLDKLLGVAGPIIFVDVPGVELFWPDNLPKRWCHNAETASP